MAKQITDQTALTTADANDVVLIRDVSAGSDKKTTVAGLATAVAASAPTGGQSSATLSNPYKFRAYRNAALSLPGGTPPVNTKIAYDAESYDTGSNFDSTTNRRFTAPIAGFYFFKARLLILGTSENGKIQLYKNGTAHSTGNNNAAANYFGHEVSDVIQLAAGDYVEVYYSNGINSTTSIEVGAANCYFTGFLVSAA